MLVCFPIWAAGQAAGQAALQPQDDPQVLEEARRLFTEGLTFVERSDWVQAEDRFRRVLALRSSHVAAYNLASALVHLQRRVEAAEILRSILRASDVDGPTRNAAQQLLLETEPGIGSLTVRISGDMTGVSFALDGRPLELTAQVQTISVDPGQHEVTAQRAGTLLTAARAKIGGDAPLQAELALELPPTLAPSRAVRLPGQSRPEPSSLSRPARDDDTADSGGVPFWLWAAGGVAVAAAAVVTVLALGSQAESAQPVAGDTDPPLVRGRGR